MKNIITPIVVGVILAISGNYVTTQQLLTEVSSKVDRNTESVGVLQTMFESLQLFQIEMSKTNERLSSAKARLSILEGTTGDRYTKSDAKKDQALIMEKLKNLEYRISKLRAD